MNENTTICWHHVRIAWRFHWLATGFCIYYTIKLNYVQQCRILKYKNRIMNKYMEKENKHCKPFKNICFDSKRTLISREINNDTEIILYNVSVSCFQLPCHILPQQNLLNYPVFFPRFFHFYIYNRIEQIMRI